MDWRLEQNNEKKTVDIAFECCSARRYEFGGG
jgi:hypothetical protein